MAVYSPTQLVDRLPEAVRPLLAEHHLEGARIAAYRDLRHDSYAVGINGNQVLRLDAALVALGGPYTIASKFMQVCAVHAGQVESFEAQESRDF